MYPTEDGGLTSERGISRPRPRDERMEDRPSAGRPMTRLQERLQSEAQMHAESQMERRERGGPEHLGEIDRELTMAIGALEGLFQRIGALAAVLEPVLTPGAAQRDSLALRKEPEEFEINSQVGRRVADIRRAITECEDVLGSIGANVRL